MAHAAQVAGECAKDSVYQGAAIRVMDDDGNEVAIVPIVTAPDRRKLFRVVESGKK